MRRVVLESPWRPPDDEHQGHGTHRAYALACLRDCLSRGESPTASHLLLPLVLDDNEPHERALGITAGHAWIDVAEALVVYTDRGISKGMQAGINAANLRGVTVEFRKLNGGAA